MIARTTLRRKEHIMNICGKRMYSLLEKLNFERLSTFEGEKKAAEILAEEIRSLGIEPTIETFPAPRYTIKTAKLEVTAPFYKEYKVNGYGFAGNAAADGIEAELVYLEEFDPIDLQDIGGKIVFVANGLRPKDFKTLLEAGVVGAITGSGMSYDTPVNADLDQKMLRPLHIEHGQLPTVSLQMKDAMELVASKPEKIKLTLAQDEGEADSQNVMAEIKGTKYPDEVIVYTAHYDSVVYSHGMYDNASGTATILELLRYYAENPPKRTLRFIWCGSEERGLLGSKFYVKAHEEELNNIRLCINVDMTGPIFGRDFALVTGEEALCHYITYLYKELDHPMSVLQEICSSDSIPFADKGIPCVNFLRRTPKNASQIHSRNDVIDIISPDAMERTARFIAAFSNRMLEAKFFPIDKVMPPIMVEKVDKYLHKKPAQ